MLGTVWLIHYRLLCIISSWVNKEILSVIECDIGCCIEVKIDILQILNICASSIGEAVFVVLSHDALSCAAVESGDVTKEVRLQVAPDTGR